MKEWVGWRERVTESSKNSFGFLARTKIANLGIQIHIESIAALCYKKYGLGVSRSAQGSCLRGPFVFFGLRENFVASPKWIFLLGLT
jgi:hypothetical protein